MRLYIRQFYKHFQILLVDLSVRLAVDSVFFFELGQVVLVLAPSAVIDESAHAALHIGHELPVELVIVVLKRG